MRLSEATAQFQQLQNERNNQRAECAFLPPSENEADVGFPEGGIDQAGRGVVLFISEKVQRRPAAGQREAEPLGEVPQQVRREDRQGKARNDALEGRDHGQALPPQVQLGQG